MKQSLPLANLIFRKALHRFPILTCRLVSMRGDDRIGDNLAFVFEAFNALSQSLPGNTQLAGKLSPTDTTIAFERRQNGLVNGIHSPLPRMLTCGCRLDRFSLLQPVSGQNAHSQSLATRVCRRQKSMQKHYLSKTEIYDFYKQTSWQHVAFKELRSTLHGDHSAVPPTSLRSIDRRCL